MYGFSDPLNDFHLIQGCHLSSTSKFPDFSLIFPWHFKVFHTLWQIKKSFLFFTLMVLTVSLLREQILSFKSSPKCGGRWA